MTNTAVRVLSLGESKYNQGLVKAKPGPSIRVEVKDIDAKSAVQEGESEIEDPIIFTKRNGKFVLLLGNKRYQKKTEEGDVVVEGRLLSTVAFKSCRLPTQEELDAAAQAEASRPQRSYDRSYDRSFANNPRVSDNRPHYRGKQ